MLKNFFRTALRTIQKNQAYALINFIGLTCGITLALLVVSYVRSELSYDDFHQKIDRLYRLRYTAPNGLELASTPPPIAPRLKEYFPEVEDAARVYLRSATVSRTGANESFEQDNIAFADSALMNMMTFEFVRGSAATALDDKFAIYLTEETAKKYFGDQDPVNESMMIAGNSPFKVAGVVKNFPENSHIRFDMLVPYDDMFDLESPNTARILRQNLEVNFVISHSYTYVLLKPGANPDKFNENMGAFVKKYALPQLQVGQVFSLMPVKDIHLKSTLLAEPRLVNSMTNLYIFIAVGVLTILIACINYINLSTAQSFTRIKEIAVRKILGSMKGQLIAQFLSETFIFSAGAIIISYGLLHLTLPLLNEMMDTNLEFEQVVDAKLVLTSIIILLVVTLTAGGYPAWFVTRFNSINAIKGHGVTHHGSQWLRKGLVVFQLAVACMLLSGALLIVRQLDFLSDRPLGFQKEHTITVPLFSSNLNGYFRQNDSTFWTRLQSFKDAVETEAGITGTALSSAAPGLGAVFRGTVPEGFMQQDNMFVANMSIDYDLMKLYGMELVAGRGFSREYPGDVKDGFIVNETAVHEFKWNTPQEAIGKTINVEGKQGKVVGVIKDFNFSSLTTPVSAMILEMNPNLYSTFSIKFENEKVTEKIERVKSEWNKLFPEKTFAYTFLDEQLNQQYNNFQNFGSIIRAFAFIAIVISCLGVYGLVLFIVQRKVKEIGVRKVLGANVVSILQLIYKDFAWLIAGGFVIAVPVSYYFINQWMSNFTYRVGIDPLSYIISFALILAIVALTISYQAVRASLANPVNSLRSE